MFTNNDIFIYDYIIENSFVNDCTIQLYLIIEYVFF